MVDAISEVYNYLDPSATFRKKPLLLYCHDTSEAYKEYFQIWLKQAYCSGPTGSPAGYTYAGYTNHGQVIIRIQFNSLSPCTN